MQPSTDIPRWLTEGDSPFRADTRAHLLNVAARDPRVIELVTRIQAKSPGEGSKEREWARAICSGDLKKMQHITEHFPDPQDLDDVLRLAAYRSDYSYADYFKHYAATARKTWAEHAETTRLIAPVVAELQPEVALGYAKQIIHAYQHTGALDEAVGLFSGIAQQRPRRVLTQFDRLRDLPHEARQTVLEQAEAAHAKGVEEPEQGSLDKVLDMSQRFGRDWRSDQTMQRG